MNTKPVLPIIAPVVLVRIREQYGVRVAHPANPTAELFATLAGTKTLTPSALNLIELLGFAIQVQDEPSALDALRKAVQS